MNEKTFSAWVNPLQIIARDFPSNSNDVDWKEEIIRFASHPSASQSTEDILQEYDDINQAGKYIFFAPSQDDILNKLIWPLKAAKASYMLGNYLATIALCGMVAEMLPY